MTETRGRVIYHLMSADAWHGERSGPIAADQLERHGFVHCCTREQILEVAAWWLAGDAPLVAVALDADRAGDLRFERADLGREYPHVYNALPREALLGSERLDDVTALPPTLAEPPPSFRLDGRRAGREQWVVWRGGRLVAGSEELRQAAEGLVASGATVPQFPGVTTRASLVTAYDAFCVLASLLEDIVSYRGDGFFDDSEGGA